MQNPAQPSFFDQPAIQPAPLAQVSPAAAVAAILAQLAPLYSPAQVAAECCSSPFRNRLIARVSAAAGGSTPAEVRAALRAAQILP